MVSKPRSATSSSSTAAIGKTQDNEAQQEVDTNSGAQEEQEEGDCNDKATAPVSKKIYSMKPDDDDEAEHAEEEGDDGDEPMAEEDEDELAEDELP